MSPSSSFARGPAYLNELDDKRTLAHSHAAHHDLFQRIAKSGGTTDEPP
jgi:hypothetical protein